MHSIRRAAVRAASSSGALSMGVSRQQLLSLAMRQSKANARPSFTLLAARSFSQSARVAQDGEKQVIEEATKAYEQDTTTAEFSDAVAERDYSRTSPSTQSQRRGEDDGHGIFVSNMAYEATEEHLREAFGKYGDIENITIARDPKGLSRGFAFITFADRNITSRVVEETNNSFWHGRRIMVAPRTKRAPKTPRESSTSTPSPSLYIGNIPYECSDADLNRMFRELENVTDVRVAVDRNTGWPRGFAHADFVDVESAQNAMDKLRETALKGRKLRVDFSAGQTRDRPRRDQGARRYESEEM